MIKKINPKNIEYGMNIQTLCKTPYYGHPKGCPNFDHKKGCPPQFLIDRILDMNKMIYVIYTTFRLDVHCVKMRMKHPDWTERQVRCCLYWQQKARKEHNEEIKRAIDLYGLTRIVRCPEAYGVNVTHLMWYVDIILEWMPRKKVRIVSLAQ